MSTLFLVPLLYGGQEQIVRQMRDELLNSSREVQKEAKAAWSAWRSFRLELDLLCFFVCYRQDEEASLAAGGSSKGL